MKRVTKQREGKYAKATLHNTDCQKILPCDHKKEPSFELTRRLDSYEHGEAIRAFPGWGDRPIRSDARG